MPLWWYMTLVHSGNTVAVRGQAHTHHILTIHLLDAILLPKLFDICKHASSDPVYLVNSRAYLAVKLAVSKVFQFALALPLINPIPDKPQPQVSLKTEHTAASLKE